MRKATNKAQTQKLQSSCTCNSLCTLSLLFVVILRYFTHAHHPSRRGGEKLGEGQAKQVIEEAIEGLRDEFDQIDRRTQRGLSKVCIILFVAHTSWCIYLD